MDLSPQKFICQVPFVKALPKPIINEFMQKYIILPRDVNDVGKLFRYTAALEPCTVAPWVRISRVRMAYGDRGIPKLKRGLSSRNTILIEQSLCSLMDIVNDPEMAAVAMEKNVVARLAPLMVHEKDIIRTKACAALRLLAVQAKGRCCIVENDYLLGNLKKCMVDKVPIVKNTSSCTMLSLAENYFAVPKLIAARFIPYIIEILVKEEYLQISAVLNHLTSLELLMDFSYDAKVEAIAFDVLELKPYLDDFDDSVRALTAAVFAQVFLIDIGKMAALNHDLIPVLCRGLSAKDDTVKGKMTKALSFATIPSEGRKIAENEGILPVLLDHIVSPHSSTELRLYSLKVLTNLSELPDVRTKLKAALVSIEMIPVDNLLVKRNLGKLIQSILWKP